MNKNFKSFSAGRGDSKNFKSKQTLSGEVTWKTRSRSSGVGESESRSRSPGVKFMENTESKIWKTRSLI